MSENFEKLELTPRNVYRIMKYCKKSEQSKNVIETNFYAPGVEKKAPKLPFDADQLASWRPSILYLLGQLLPVHKWQATMEPTMASYDYHKKIWTEKDNLALFSLFYLGVATGCMPPFEQNTEGKLVSSIGTAKELKPTFSPSETLSKAEQDYLVGLAAHDAEKYSAALEYFEKAAQQGHSKAQFDCGMMYDFGVGAKEDVPKALYWYEKAANQGNALAQFRCGVIYQIGFGVPKKADDLLEKYKFFKKEADLTDSLVEKGYYDIISYNSNGDTSAKDAAKALCWYEKAAAQGHIVAQFYCGNMYNKGIGTGVDKAKALYWYEKAAEQGYYDAMAKCAFMYEYGFDIKANKSKANYWNKKCDELDRRAFRNVLGIK